MGAGSAGKFAELDRPSTAYAREVSRRLREALGADLVGVYLHGSGVLGGFASQGSDVDLIAVSSRRLANSEKTTLATTLSHSALPCPARDLELHVITLESTQRLVEAPPFEFYIETGANRPQDEVNFGWNTRRADGGDTDLVMHFAVLRLAGQALTGPPPKELFPDVPPAWLREALQGELRWALEHGPPEYQVLNACRIWRFLEEGELVSKIAGGDWMASRLPDPSLVEAALKRQRGHGEVPLDPAEARRFVLLVMDRFSSGLAPGAGPRPGRYSR
jgi:predicted nucleotidyltransferase